MYIDKLDIKGFGKLEAETLHFGKGINLIYGSNESGKSTLQWFIRSMLYGLRGGRASKDGMPAPAKRFKPWNGAQFGGSMEYVLDDGLRIRVERGFDNNTVAVYDSGFNNITDSFDYTRERGPMFAERQLGINESCFEKTVFVKQMETRLDEEGRAELLERISNMSRTGLEDVSFTKAQSSLRDALKNCAGTGRTRTSQADRINGRLEELVAKRANAAVKKDLLMNAEAALNEDMQERAKLSRTREYLEQVRKLIGIRLQLEEEKTREASLSALLGEITAAEDAAAAAAAGYEALKAEQGAVPSPDSKAPSVHAGTEQRRGSSVKGSRAVPVLPIVLLVCGAAAAGTALVASPYAYALAGLLAVAGIVLLLTGAVRKEHLVQAGHEPTEDVEAAGDMDRKLKEIIRLKDVLRDLCGKASVAAGRQAGSSSEVLELLEELSGSRQMLEHRLKTGAAECAGNFGQAETEFFRSGQLSQFIADSGIKWLEDSWSYEFEKLEEKLSELGLRIRENETVLKGDTGGLQELQQLDEEIAGLEAQKNRLEDTGRSLRLALEVLEEAASEIQRDYAPALNDKMSGIIKRITGGRYGELKADSSSVLQTITPENGSVARIQVLSGGTADQMYLALRLASAELAFCGEALPLILDEAFSQYDDSRTIETMKYLGERYRDGQVLLFTCKAREKELARTAFGGNVRMIEI